MTFTRLLALTLLVSCAAATARADEADQAMGDAGAGQQKSATCAACHGADGNSANPEWPKLAGQHAPYIQWQLKMFKEGERRNPLMTAQAMALSDQDILDLAAYFSSQSIHRGAVDPDLRTLGEHVYRGGNKTAGVAACIACHGPTGSGNPAMRVPALSGQHATYVTAQLRAYAAGERRSDPNQMMRNIAAALSDEEIEAVASYVEGLRPR